MADPANPGGGDPASSTSGSSAPSQEFKAPDGKVLVDAKEWEGVSRLREQNVGYQKFHTEASRRGFKRSEDFGQYDKFSETLRGKGLTMDQVSQILAGKEQDQPEQGSVPDLAAFEKQMGTKFIPAERFESELSIRDAIYEHKSALSKESGLVEKALSEVLEGASEFEKKWVPRALRNALEERRTLYPDNHPLHPDKAKDRAQLAPLDEKVIAAVVAEIKKDRAAAAGQDLANQGDAALKGKKLSTPAGSTSSTASKPPSKADQERRPGNLPPKAAVEAEYAKRRAARSGGPVSSMGG